MWLDDWAREHEALASVVLAALLVAVTSFALLREVFRGRARLKIVGDLPQLPFDAKRGNGTFMFTVANRGGTDAELDSKHTEVFVRTSTSARSLREWWRMRPRSVRDWLLQPRSLWKRTNAEIFALADFMDRHTLANPSGFRGMKNSDNDVRRTARDYDLVVERGRLKRFILIYHDDFAASGHDAILRVRPVHGTGSRRRLDWHAPPKGS